MIEDIDYDKLIEKSLKNVVKGALEVAQKDGLANNYFYITFKTNGKGVKLADALKEQYPRNMTIVLQHQFSNLQVAANGFSVDLSFSGVPYSLEIPFDAVTYFADPYAKFGLSFSGFEAETEEKKKAHHGSAEVISIDSFRKK